MKVADFCSESMDGKSEESAKLNLMLRTTVLYSYFGWMYKGFVYSFFIAKFVELNSLSNEYN
ncbi:MAG: hypothetical protein RIT43_1049 [Bacteroidota bacterium]|jgi:hypothetical protein